MKNVPLFLICFLFALVSCTDDDTLAIIDPVEPVEFSPAVTVSITDKYEDDYILVTPIFTKDTYLLNRQGFPVRKWTSERNGLMAYLTNDGSIYRQATAPNPPVTFGGQTGIIERFDAAGTKTWEYSIINPDLVIHHDLALLPNGNLLATLWERRAASDAIDNGRDPNNIPNGNIWPDKIIELRPVANNQAEIVWEWSLWDHLVQDFDSTKANFGDVSASPERIDVNYSDGTSNFTHFNSISYIEELDQIVVSSRVFNEIWVIDHSTTTAQAATSSGGNSGKGGDLLYRWGNPQAYKAGNASDQKLFEQHDASYIGNLPNAGGSFLVFNNNISATTSAVVEVGVPINSNGSYNLQPNVVNAPSNFAFIYETTEIFSPRTSGARRLKNGNTLITSNSANIIREIDASSIVVWEYNLDSQNGFELSNNAFKVEPYPLDHPAFNGEVLPPLDPSQY
ncbi:aryl-sulfate sulfotransferase [Nonlabens marinus]|uniref:Putative PQQ enzyme repeat n=1 Tax=Nonlabens marinus S1-08 TaxID=1454201 RepID=W8VZD2_9FLAO|nr:aryl-sulfate sulfotransferase [Nonlabens marinus]BAO54371.1 putative PQQ enzyme repeat [Nonlabens marinus S1-08]